MDNSTGLPFNGSDAYQYLTTEQALEDVVYFANHFEPRGFGNDIWASLKPQKTPWIFVGGSYPGVRAAMLRVRNPETIFASWSSSAPVQSNVEMPTYFEQLAQDLPTNCSADLAAASAFFDAQMSSESTNTSNLVKWLIDLATSSDVKSLQMTLNSTEVALSRKVDHAASISDYSSALSLIDIVVSSDIQAEGTGETQKYCDLLESFDPTAFLASKALSRAANTLYGPSSNKSHITPSAAGLGATYGPRAAFAGVLYATALHTRYSADFQAPPEPLGDNNAWQWQSCTEYGNWMVANSSSPNNILSRLIDVEHAEIANCGSNSTFRSLSGVPSLPDVNKPNKYGGWRMRPSNVMFTDGLKDPWHTISVQSSEAKRETTRSVPQCNQPPTDGQVFGLTFPDGYHAKDLGFTAESGEAVALFSKALDAWLPCFNKTGSPIQTNTGLSNLRIPSIAIIAFLVGAHALSGM